MLTSLVSLLQGNVKKSKKSMKIINIDVENLHTLWTTWGISMKFSEKMWLIIILKVSKKQGFKNETKLEMCPISFTSKFFIACQYLSVGNHCKW